MRSIDAQSQASTFLPEWMPDAFAKTRKCGWGQVWCTCNYNKKKVRKKRAPVITELTAGWRIFKSQFKNATQQFSHGLYKNTLRQVRWLRPQPKGKISHVHMCEQIQCNIW